MECEITKALGVELSFKGQRCLKKSVKCTMRSKVPHLPCLVLNFEVSHAGILVL